MKTIKIDDTELSTKLKKALCDYFQQNDYNSWCYITEFSNGFCESLVEQKDLSDDDIAYLRTQYKNQVKIKEDLDKIKKELAIIKTNKVFKFLRFINIIKP